jgi:lipoate-protein ligase A
LQMNMNCHVHVFIRYYWHHPLHILGIHQASRHSLDLGS